MTFEDRAELTPLIQAFRDQLTACLEECSRGRRGLFSDREDSEPWPEAARLRELAFALQAILAPDFHRSCDFSLRAWQRWGAYRICDRFCWRSAGSS